MVPGAQLSGLLAAPAGAEANPAPMATVATTGNATTLIAAAVRARATTMCGRRPRDWRYADARRRECRGVLLPISASRPPRDAARPPPASAWAHPGLRFAVHAERTCRQK